MRHLNRAGAYSTTLTQHSNRAGASSTALTRHSNRIGGYSTALTRHSTRIGVYSSAPPEHAFFSSGTAPAQRNAVQLPRARASGILQKTGDLAREAVSCNGGLGRRLGRMIPLYQHFGRDP
jgi:hypothetical protein